MTALCALCPHYETEHNETSPGERFLGTCRARIYPADAFGPDDYEPCDCIGFEPQTDDDTGE